MSLCRFEKHPDIVRFPAFFEQVFTSSEGEDEGRLIGSLVSNLLTKTPKNDLSLYSISRESDLLGAVIFTYMNYPEDSRTIVLLSPMAIKSSEQGKGFGQKLIGFALQDLKAKGAEIAVTYGDPAFYGKSGFQQITEKVIRAPLPLSYPDGWLARPLIGSTFEIIQGKGICVDALNNPIYW